MSDKSDKKILFVVGTRPEAIKLAPLIIALRSNASQFKVVIGLSGQHPQWAEAILREFGLSPDLVARPYPLEVADLTDLQSQLLKVVKNWLLEEKPDLVIVQGDTSSAVAGALAAFYAGIPVGHVEAGLRNIDKFQPFPEELHRRVIGQIADYHFAPTPMARANLIREGVPMHNILHSGNTGIDAQRIAMAKTRGGLPESIRENLDELSDFKGKIILVTVHRRENWALFGNICQKILQFIQSGAYRLCWVAHPNPMLQREVKQLLDSSKQTVVIPPLGYMDFQQLIRHSDLLMTDSGGIQEESVGYEKPVLILRKSTEREELCQTGNALLCDPSAADFSSAITQALNISWQIPAENPFGDGFAAERIRAFLIRALLQK
jgi:UDP-N-acetylglucosamine 2-epimerase (non-hydrolysing)